MNQSWNMPSAELNHVFDHVLAKSQLFRRTSVKSNNSSPRRPNVRVAKPIGNHGVQRRRTTTAHTSQSKSRTLQSTDASQPLPQTRAAIAHGPASIGLASTSRPLTWHPGSYPLNNCPEETPHGIALDPHKFVVNQPSSSTDLSNCFPRPSVHPNAVSNIQLRNRVLEDHLQQAPIDLTTYPYPHYNPSSSFLHCSDGIPYSYESSFTDFQTVDFAQMPSDYAACSSQRTPDTCQYQVQPSAPQYVQSQLPIQITKQRSKELVGMGLYDGPSRKELSALNVSPNHIDQFLAQPRGKGLKLEETWQPPDDDGHDAVEEGYSTDEAEEDIPHAPASHEAHPALLPATYADLSNQSFFFDSDDPYANYMSFDPGVGLCQPRISIAGNENFLWL
ncbi:MAG: hypothetical protein Q9205_001548 [Flavoplaca limonia]